MDRKIPATGTDERTTGSTAALQRKNMQVLVDSKLNMNKQSTLATMKPNSILHWMNKSLASRLRKAIVSLYLAVIRPHLEYCNLFGM